ncbi:unnamed protein product [Ilex paraguariensis]|uniref:Uncharacterized protein n=1 Tax=Ilex paraguariensis TaxID=185542 RepID=A0ABC8QY58_9AQUA
MSLGHDSLEGVKPKHTGKRVATQLARFNLICVRCAGLVLSIKLDTGQNEIDNQVPPNNFSDDMSGYPPFPADTVPTSSELPEADILIVTSGGLRIPAQASILVLFSIVIVLRH